MHLLLIRFLAFIPVPSQILFSSNCTKTANQLNCSCETVGNPTPMTHWFLNGQSVSQSSQVVVTNEFLDNSHLRSIITVNEPQNKDLSTLLCFSSNSLGSASKQLFDRCLESLRENQGLPFFLSLIGQICESNSCCSRVILTILFYCRSNPTVWFHCHSCCLCTGSICPPGFYLVGEGAEYYPEKLSSVFHFGILECINSPLFT